MIGIILALAVAALQAYIVALEMLLWERPRTRAAFGTTEEFARETKVLAANQGLYNGFLAAGIVLGLWAAPVLLFSLACVLVAGLYGGATANPRIWLVQALPAALALAALWTGL